MCDLTLISGVVSLTIAGAPWLLKATHLAPSADAVG
jgi:hypothetical protein